MKIFLGFFTDDSSGEDFSPNSPEGLREHHEKDLPETISKLESQRISSSFFYF